MFCVTVAPFLWQFSTKNVFFSLKFQQSLFANCRRFTLSVKTSFREWHFHLNMLLNNQVKKKKEAVHVTAGFILQRHFALYELYQWKCPSGKNWSQATTAVHGMIPTIGVLQRGRHFLPRLLHSHFYTRLLPVRKVGFFFYQLASRRRRHKSDISTWFPQSAAWETLFLPGRSSDRCLLISKESLLA